MIKSIVEQKGSNYPVIKILPNSKVIVLFTGPGTGVILDEGACIDRHNGELDDWTEDEFEIFNGKITLENE